MQRLKTRDNSKLAEARDILSTDGFDMFNTWARTVRMIAFLGFLIRIQRQAHRPVPNGMSKNLQSTTIQFLDGLLIFLRLPEKFSSLRGVIAIRCQHGCGVCFDYAIEHGFHYAARNPFIVIGTTRQLNLVDGIASQVGRVEKVSDVKTESEFVLAAQFVVKIKILEILPRAVHAHQP